MNKRQILEYLLNTNASLSWQQMLFSLLMSLLLGVALYFVYRLTYRGTVYSKSFNQTLVLICVITTAVIVIIGANLALSLGMVGSLSIIRFRTAVKEPRDIAFLFWAICIGLACGSEYYLIGITVSVIITLALVVGNLDLYDSVSYLLVVRGGREAPFLPAVQAILKANTRSQKLRMQSETSDTKEATYELRLREDQIEPMMSALHTVHGVDSVNLVSYSGELLG